MLLARGTALAVTIGLPGCRVNTVSLAISPTRPPGCVQTRKLLSYEVNRLTSSAPAWCYNLHAMDARRAPPRNSSLAALAAGPIRTEPNVTHYEWAGRTLQALLGSPQRVAETWAFFSGPQKPARIAGAAEGQVTMEDRVTKAPEVLGPAGADPDNHRQKYFFVKFLDPSDFPPFAYVGFNPDGLRDLGVRPDTLRHCVSTLLWEDRLTLESLAELLRPSLTSRAACERFTASYKRWAIEEAVADWAGRSNREWIGDFTTPALAARAQELLARLAHHRRRMVGLMHRIPFRPDQAILIESPTLHAIAGLSLQLHPNVPGNFHPKDELWIYKEIRCPDGSTGWMLVEPQRTFDKTDSGADFFTPFVWEDREGLGFRRAISPWGLEQFVQLMAAPPRPAPPSPRQGGGSRP